MERSAPRSQTAPPDLASFIAVPAARTLAKFPVDKPGNVRLLFRAMSQPEQKYTSPASLAVDAVLVVAFFAYMYNVLGSHVPSTDPKMIVLWGALGAACMSGVFWLCIQMFRVVFRAQREAGKK